MDFVRSGNIKETLDIGDKDHQLIQKVHEEATRLGLYMSPENDVGGLFPRDEFFRDIAQWVHPESSKSGILLSVYTDGDGIESYHLQFINQRGHSRWDEHQDDIEGGMEILRRSFNWEDLARCIEE